MPTTSFDPSLPAIQRRDPRAAALAVLLHLLLLALVVRGAHEAAERAQRTEAGLLAGARGGGGGTRQFYIGSAPRSTSAVRLPTPVPPPVATPVRAPTVPVAAPPLAPPTPAVAAPAASSTPTTGEGAAGSGGGSGGGQGTGTGSGVGSGQGPGTGTGDGSDAPVAAPVWRAGALPFEAPPKELRGRSVEVRFAVRADGRVEQVEVTPALPDGPYADRFLETMRGFRFLPARTASGRAVPGSVVLTFQLPSR